MGKDSLKNCLHLKLNLKYPEKQNHPFTWKFSKNKILTFSLKE